MNDAGSEIRTFVVSDGYPLHVRLWPAVGSARGLVVVLHGVQSHGGWYHGLGRTLASAGYSVSFPDRRGSGANSRDRGHTPSPRRLNLDVADWLLALRTEHPGLPVALAGISWGGKLAVIAAARHPELVDRTLALIGRAGAIYPFFRTSALLRHLDGRTRNVPVVLLYPGERRGATGLSFMGMLNPDNDYRPRIYP